MGDAKLRIERNEDETPKLSTHIVECFDMLLPTEPEIHSSSIERAYQRLAARAKEEDSFILNVVQTVNVYQLVDSGTQDAAKVFTSHMLVAITAQRISRAELEQQQRMQRMGIK